jgi:hypothetical protein
VQSGYSRLASANPLPTFSLQEGAAKKKLTKRNGVFVGAAHTRPLFEKRGAKTYTQSLCEQTHKSKFENRSCYLFSIYRLGVSP